MAYMNQAKKAELAPGIKAVLKKYDMKGTISVHNYSTLVVKIKSGALAFDAHENVNTYWINEHYTGEQRKFLTELKHAMMIGNHDNSDSQIDYFDVGWYIDIVIGNWDKPYVYTGETVLEAA